MTNGRPPQRFCTHCGSELESGARFCTGCGSPTGTTTPPPSQTHGSTDNTGNTDNMTKGTTARSKTVIAGTIVASILALSFGGWAIAGTISRNNAHTAAANNCTDAVRQLADKQHERAKQVNQAREHVIGDMMTDSTQKTLPQLGDALNDYDAAVTDSQQLQCPTDAPTDTLDSTAEQARAALEKQDKLFAQVTTTTKSVEASAAQDKKTREKEQQEKEKKQKEVEQKKKEEEARVTARREHDSLPNSDMYLNEKYQYHVSLPYEYTNDAKPRKDSSAPAEDDGFELGNMDSDYYLTITAEGKPNTENLTPESYLAQRKAYLDQPVRTNFTVDYEFTDTDIAVVTGEMGDHLYYTRVLFRGDDMLVLDFSWPHMSEKQVTNCERLIETIAPTFNYEGRAIK